jgi:hypothetical protein
VTERIPWGFTVEEHEGGYTVFLPHQCESWAISEPYEYVDKEQAAVELEDFLAEGQRALEALRRGEPVTPNTFR